MTARVYLGCVFAMALLTACAPDFDKSWQVRDRRLLAIQADTPELLLAPDEQPFPKVTLRPFLVEPISMENSVGWRAFACSAEERTCDRAQASMAIGDGTSSLREIQVSFTLEQTLLNAARDADPFRGFGGVAVMIEFQIDDDLSGKVISGVKRVVYGTNDIEGKTANRNPQIARLLVDNAELRDDMKFVSGSEITLLPQMIEGSRETYLVETYTGGTRTLDEYLSYDYFVTNGDLSHAQTGGKPSPFIDDKKTDDISVTWRLPETAGRYPFWIVVRDDRGGVTWIEKTMTVTSP